MAKSVLDIVIKLTKEGGADKETIQGLVSVKTAILNAAAVAGVFVAAGYTIKKVLDETVGTLVAYAEQVRRVQNATGANAEDSSKLIQILDDQKISYEQLEKAIQKSGKAYDFSINGIANMSDAYLQLGNEQEKAAFMQERFGKQWISFVPIMQQGKQAILDQANAVEKGLVLTQQSIVETRLWEIQMDNFNDKVEAAKISFGQGLLGMLDGSTLAIQKNAQAIFTAANGYTFFVDRAGHYTAAQRAAWEEAKKQAEAEYVKAHSIDTSKKAIDGAVPSLEDYTKKLQEASAANQSMLGLITNIASENKSYADKQAELTGKMQENRAEAEKLYPWQSKQLDELNQKYADMAATYDANAAAHNAAMGKIQYDLLITKLSADGLTDSEYQIAQQAGLMFGVFDQNSITQADNMNKLTAAVSAGVLSVNDMGTALAMLPDKKNIDVILNAMVSIAGGAQAAYFQNGSTTRTRQTQQGGFAEGGIATGPAAGHMELLHGTEAIIPLQNGSVPVQLQDGAGGGTTNVSVQLTISSPVTILDQQTAQKTLLPYIIQGVRDAKARGAL